MHHVNFEGAIEINKPANTMDERDRILSEMFRRANPRRRRPGPVQSFRTLEEIKAMSSLAFDENVEVNEG